MIKHIQLIKVLVLGIYTLLIAYVSLVNDSSAHATVPDLNRLGVANLDKIAHICAYTVFGFAATTVFGVRRLREISIILLLFGLSLEVLQGWLTDREASIADFVANAVGIILSILLVLSMAKLPTNKFIKTIIPDLDKI